MSLRLALVTAAVGLGLTTGCSLFRTEYPPAYPAPRWDPTKPFLFVKAPPPKDFCPQPVKRVVNTFGLPSAEEWRGQWKLKPVTQKVCRGKGKQRRCRSEPSTAVDKANEQSVLRATPWNTKQGSSGNVRFPFEPGQEHIYEIVTSPHEVTYLALLDGERQATQLLLNPDHWEVLYGKSGQEGSRQEVITVRPIVQADQSLPPPTRAAVIYQSGKKQRLLFKAQPRPGMLTVEWYIPEEDKTPPPPPVDQQPPAFDGERAYAGYTITLKGKSKYQPPWFPEAVLDDGTNTLIKFRTAFEGVPLPIVSAVQQNGQPALVQTRLYVRPGHGAWIWAQGLRPAWRLKDAAGILVEAVRTVPTPGQELRHDDLKVSQMDDPPLDGSARHPRDSHAQLRRNLHHDEWPATRADQRLGAEFQSQGPSRDASGWQRDGRPADDDDHDDDRDDLSALRLALGPAAGPAGRDAAPGW